MKRGTRLGLKHLLAVLFTVAAVIAFGALGGCAASPSPDTGATGAASASPAAGSTTASDEPPMKTIGIIGGISWLSTLEYYRQINEMFQYRLGPLYSAPIPLYSIAFGEFSRQERLAANGDWRTLRQTMVEAARSLERGGADFIIVASNTMSSTDDLIAENVKIPVLNIIDAVGMAVNDRGLKTVALLGTKYTMEEDFYKGRLERDYGLKVVTPNAAERDYINDVIFNELCAGVFRKRSRDRFVKIIDRLVKEEGAEGAILGCTEIPLLMKDADTHVPTFDTTQLHSAAAVRYSLGEE